MTLDDYKARYSGLSEREVSGLVHSSSEFRTATEALYEFYFRQQINTSCGDCWKDAYILLLTQKTNKDMETEMKFTLKAGALLRDVRNMNDSSRLATRLNLTDDLALYHLGTNPDYIKFFSKYPANWRELAKKYISKLDAPEDVEEKKAAPTAVAPEDVEEKKAAPTAVAPEKSKKSTRKQK